MARLGFDRTNVVAWGVGIVLALAIIFGTRFVSAQVIACQQVNSLRGALVTILQNGERAAPQNPYFAQHPKALIQAQQQYRQALKALSPTHCS